MPKFNKPQLGIRDGSLFFRYRIKLCYNPTLWIESSIVSVKQALHLHETPSLIVRSPFLMVKIG